MIIMLCESESGGHPLIFPGSSLTEQRLRAGTHKWWWKLKQFIREEKGIPEKKMEKDTDTEWDGINPRPSRPRPSVSEPFIGNL